MPDLLATARGSSSQLQSFGKSSPRRTPDRDGGPARLLPGYHHLRTTSAPPSTSWAPPPPGEHRPLQSPQRRRSSCPLSETIPFSATIDRHGHDSRHDLSSARTRVGPRSRSCRTGKVTRPTSRSPAGRNVVAPDLGAPHRRATPPAFPPRSARRRPARRGRDLTENPLPFGHRLSGPTARRRSRSAPTIGVDLSPARPAGPPRRPRTPTRRRAEVAEHPVVTPTARIVDAASSRSRAAAHRVGTLAGATGSASRLAGADRSSRSSTPPSPRGPVSARLDGPRLTAGPPPSATRFADLRPQTPITASPLPVEVAAGAGSLPPVPRRRLRRTAP